MFAHIFPEKTTQNPKEDTKPMDRKLISTFKSLEYEERKKEQQAQEKKKRPMTNILWLDDTAKEDMIVTEMSKMMDKKKSWKTLDACFKWRVIEEYIQNTNIIPFNKATIKHLKDALRHGKLANVEYDHSGRRINSLNYVVDGIAL